jgi:hypothetical protein
VDTPPRPLHIDSAAEFPRLRQLGSGWPAIAARKKCDVAFMH